MNIARYLALGSSGKDSEKFREPEVMSSPCHWITALDLQKCRREQQEGVMVRWGAG